MNTDRTCPAFFNDLLEEMNIPKYPFNTSIWGFVDKIIRNHVNISKKIQSHSSHRKLKVSHINEYLSTRGIEPLFGYNSETKTEYIKAGNDGKFDILVPNDRKIDLNQLSNFNLKPYPEERLFHFHWMAIKGIQPRIPENNKYVKAILIEDKLFSNTNTQ